MHSGRSVLVTGSNRGLGLEWVRQYAGLGWQVYATCRYPQQADELKKLADEFSNIFIHRLDVTREDEIRQLATQLDDEPIDLLINNAGVYYERWGKDRLGVIDYSNWNETLAVNTLGPMRISEAFIDNIARSEKRLIITITSHMGSIADIGTPNDYAYRSSKSALNAAMKGLSLELADRDIGVMLLHPGWVRTRMGGDSAPLSAQESVSAMRQLVERFRPCQTGRFFRYDGSEIPW
jgi:NAD(P)-dependent dehydrogenase (short-subunit alcohol dehydrogenase family)